MEPTLTALIAAGVLATSSIVAWLNSARKQRSSVELALKKVLSALSSTPLQPLHEGKGYRATINADANDRVVLDVVLASSPLLFMVRAHRYISTSAQQPPPSVSLTLNRAATAANPGAQGIICQASPTTLIVDGQELNGPAAELLAGLSPELLTAIVGLEDFYTEPLVEVKLEARWFSATRHILGNALKVRELKQPRQLEHYLELLLVQTAKLASLDPIAARSAPQLLSDVFSEAEPFGALRNQSLRTLMTAHWGSPEAEAQWRYVLQRGNLYDALLLLNIQQQRFLDEISPGRLLALVNGIQQSGRFETSALPQLLTRRFDLRVLLNTHLDWEVCVALARLGMRELPAAQTLPVLIELYGQQPLARRLELLELAQEADYLPMVEVITAHGFMPGAPALMLRSAELVETLGQRHPEQIVNAALEQFLLELLGQDMDPICLAAINALACVGMAPAYNALDAMLQGQSLALGRMPTRARRAMGMILARLKAQPTHGAVTLMAQDEGLGALSISQTHGELELLDEDPAKDPQP